MKKSCFKCFFVNQCKHYEKIFNKFELTAFMENEHEFINILADEVGKHCRYWIEEKRKEFLE